MRVFHKSRNVAVKPARMRVWHPRAPRYGGKNAAPSRRARACPSPCVLLSERITPVGQDRLKLWHICQAILTRSGAGAPELQRWARCLPVVARPPRRDNYRNGVMKHPQSKYADAAFPFAAPMPMRHLRAHFHALSGAASRVASRHVR